MLKDNLVDFLIKNNYDYLLVNSTNEFLVEYNEIGANARFHLTGFSGSTGEALLNKSGEVYLFVDGRYHKQADNQVFSYVNVVKMGLGETFLASVADKIKDNSKIAIVPNTPLMQPFKSHSAFTFTATITSITPHTAVSITIPVALPILYLLFTKAPIYIYAHVTAPIHKTGIFYYR